MVVENWLPSTIYGHGIRVAFRSFTSGCSRTGTRVSGEARPERGSWVAPSRTQHSG